VEGEVEVGPLEFTEGALLEDVRGGLFALFARGRGG
jgi:hypothetical protein